MNWASYSPVFNSGVHDFSTNTSPADYLTPLYKEVLELISKAGSRGINMSMILTRIKATKHSSRIRLAVEALEDMGRIEVVGTDLLKFRVRDRDLYLSVGQSA